MIPRIEELPAAATVGAWYLVPTVVGDWYGKVKAWPVIGPRHNDRHCIGFESDHYHLDARFMSGDETDIDYWQSVWGSPLQINKRVNVSGLPAPIWKRRLCKRLVNPAGELLNRHVVEAVESGRADGWKCHFDEWTGRQAKRDGRGWVCPHRAVPLADQVVVNGVITCPLHLLRIDNETGVVLPPQREVL